MNKPIRTLPIIELWDCHNCGNCCRGTTVILDKDDCAKLSSQGWASREDFKGVPVISRESLLGGSYVLSKKEDGSCVFLNADGLCRIHAEFGEDAKPSVCRMYPFQLVSLEKQTNLTLRFGCPSAALGDGEPLQKKLPRLRKSQLLERFHSADSSPPSIARRGKRTPRDFEHVAEALRQFVADERMPLVRRVVHGLRFCSLLDACDLNTHDDQTFRELIQLFQLEAIKDVGELFRDRKSPSSATSFLFRQAAVHFVRSHPTFPATNTWRDRIRLMISATRFARGGRTIPAIHPHFKATKFEMLDEPLGPLAPEVLEPLDRFIESNATSLQYALPHRDQTLVSSFRALALGVPVALWMLRFMVGSQTPTQDDMVSIVAALDRGQGTNAIAKTASLLGSSDVLERLVAWFAR